MNSNAVLECRSEHAAALNAALKSYGAGDWESFAYAPGESATSLHLEGKTARFLGIRGAQSELDTPLFEERYAVGGRQRSAEHYVMVGERLGAALKLDPRTVLTGPAVTDAFNLLHKSVVAHLSAQSPAEPA